MTVQSKTALIVTVSQTKKYRREIINATDIQVHSTCPIAKTVVWLEHLRWAIFRNQYTQPGPGHGPSLSCMCIHLHTK